METWQDKDTTQAKWQ